VLLLMRLGILTQLNAYATGHRHWLCTKVRLVVQQLIKLTIMLLAVSG
jgi:hypothetical protein